MIPDMPHGDLGMGNSFETFDRYQYGASSRIPDDLDDPQAWNSFFHVFSFPLGKSENVEVMTKEASWRRRTAGSNVDNRWGFLQLVKDEVNGEIYLYESRREFLETRASAR